eukprot:991210-Rhodomonas_salina.3
MLLRDCACLARGEGLGHGKGEERERERERRACRGGCAGKAPGADFQASPPNVGIYLQITHRS